MSLFIQSIRVDLFRLILDIFLIRQLCSYLTNFEKNKLSQTCKEIRSLCLELKLVTYKLTRDTSLKFYRGFLQENNAMVCYEDMKVYSKICNQQLKGVKIISVDLSNTKYQFIDLKKFGDHLEIINLNYSKNLQELLNMPDKLIDIDLSYCESFDDFTKFTNVKKLSFGRSNNCRISNYDLTGLSSLENIQVLSIKHSRISELHNLKNIHTLTLEECYRIRDVSDLSNIHTLKLVECNAIVDISPLLNVSNLTIKNCRRITNVSMLANVKKLIISNCYNINNWGSICYTFDPVSGLGTLSLYLSLSISISLYIFLSLSFFLPFFLSLYLSFYISLTLLYI